MKCKRKSKHVCAVRGMLLVVAMSFPILSVPHATSAEVTPVPAYPEATWKSRTPAEVGMDPAKVDAALASLKGLRDGCLVRYGYMVKTWGEPKPVYGGGSEIKPFVTHFLFKAMEEGKIPSLDAKVRDFEPRLDALNPELGFKDRNITWEHLAMQDSCYGVREPPGTAFNYNDWNLGLFAETLFFKVYGADSWNEVNSKILGPKLADHLQWQDQMSWDEHGRLALSSRDHARFGLLYLRKGNWKGKQLISAANAVKAVRSPLPGSFPISTGDPTDVEMIPNQYSFGEWDGNTTGWSMGKKPVDHRGSYSFTWWLNGTKKNGERRLPNVPMDVYGCESGAMHIMYVFPSLDLIVSWRRWSSATKGEDHTAVLNAFLSKVADAVVSSAPVGNAGGDKGLALPAAAGLDATVTDEGRPTPPGVTVSWSQVSGPGKVTFANRNVVDARATFSTPGTYVLRLTASDNLMRASDEVTMTVLKPSKPVSQKPLRDRPLAGQ